jgi:hypothetical protein
VWRVFDELRLLTTEMDHRKLGSSLVQTESGGAMINGKAAMNELT